MNLPTVEVQALSAAGVLFVAATLTPKVADSRARTLGLSAMLMASIFALAAALGMPDAGQSLGAIPTPDGAFLISIVIVLLFQGFAFLIAMPRTSSAAASVFDILVVQAGSLLVLLSDNAAIKIIGWIATLIPAYVTVGANARFTRNGSTPRSFLLYQYMSVATYTAGGLLQVYDSSGYASAALALTALAGLLRQGIPPFHTPMLRFFETGRLTYVLPFTGTPLGILVVAAAVRDLNGLWDLEIGGLVATLAMAALTYLGLLALAQQRCRSLLCYATLFSWTLAALCLSASGQVNHDAGLLMVLGSMGSIVGLGIAVWLLSERVGEVSIPHVSGLASKLPTLSGMFVIFGLIIVGLPFSASFASEDLWLHGLSRQTTAAGALVIVGWSLVAIAIFRMYTLIFLGPARGVPCTQDLSLRERFAFAIALAIIILFSVKPGISLQRIPHGATAEAKHSYF